MYVSIDRENLRFLHKHEDVHVVCNLVHIEAPHVAISIEPYDTRHFLSNWTDMEMTMLYRNTTGVDHTGRHGEALRALLAELAERLPVSDVNKFELDRQAAYIAEDNSEPMRYVKGATRPGVAAELFPLTAPKNENEDAVIPVRKLYAPQRPAQAKTSARPTVTPGPTAKPAQRAQSVPKAGGVRATIWEVADKLWEQAGKPTAKSEVLALRKRMMDVLETDYEVKRTSSSNELGQWQKSRVVTP